MAGKKKGRSGKRKAAPKKFRGKTVATPGYAGNKFDCAGKTVRNGKGRGQSPRVFCANVKNLK